MFSLIKKALIVVLISTANSLKCISLRNQEFRVRKVVINNDYMTYPFNIEVHTCNGSCDNVTDLYSKMSVPDVIKNNTVKVLNLILQQSITKQIAFHESCKYVCTLDPTVFNNKQKWNKDKCSCECLIDEKCKDNKFRNPINCECELQKVYLMEEFEKISDNTIILQNKTMVIKELAENCKPFFASSILFLSVSTIVTGIFIHFYCK